MLFAIKYAKKGFTCYAFFVAANFAFRTLRLRKVQQRAVAAPLRKNLFFKNIFARNMVILICAEALLRKSEVARAKLLRWRAARKTEHKAVGDCWVFLKIVRLFLSVQKETDERKISDTSRASLRSMPLFAAHAAWGWV